MKQNAPGVSIRKLRAAVVSVAVYPYRALPLRVPPKR